MQLKVQWLAVFALASFGGAASADTVYNSALPSATGWNVGSGQSNSNFKVVTTTNSHRTLLGWRNGTVEQGLRASLRYVGAVDDTYLDGTADGVYHVQAGVSQAPNVALWNFDYSINLSGHYNVLNTTNWLYVDVDPTAATDFIPINLDLLYPFQDPIQDSQNIGFYALPPLFDANAAGTYDIALGTFYGTQLVGANSIQIVVSDEVPGAGAAAAPLPSAAMAGVPGLALAALRRRR